MKTKERDAWKKWNQEQQSPQLTAEQCLEWLDGMRALMFEVWKHNPELKEKFIKLRSAGF